MAFSQGLGSGFILTKPFVYGGILDRKFGNPEANAGYRAVLEASLQQNAISYGAGNCTGEVASQMLVGEALGGVKAFGKAGEAVSQLTKGKIRAKFASNVLAGTTVDTIVDTVPIMVEVGTTKGATVGDVLGAGAKSAGMNLVYNIAGESVSAGIKRAVSNKYIVEGFNDVHNQDSVKNLMESQVDDIVEGIDTLKKVENVSDVSKANLIEGGTKTDFSNDGYRSGAECNEYFVEKYGAENVQWETRPIEGGSVSVNPNEIRFSQSSVNGSEEIIASMKKNGWNGSPIDIVEMPDGVYTTIDNTRVVSARQAGINVEANIHSYNEVLPSEYIERFTTKKGVPTTWGEAIELRVGKQKASFRNGNPFGSFEMENIN